MLSIIMAVNGLSLQEILARLFLDRTDRAQRSWRLLSQAECNQVHASRPTGMINFRIPHIPAIDTWYRLSKCSWDEEQLRAKLTLDSSFPLLRGLFAAHRGQLIAAGGSVARAVSYINNTYLTCDCDLFFVGGDPDTALISSIKYICEHAELSHGINIERGRHVVNVFVGSTKYSFVLRKYPSPVHALGGFDISAAAVMYDGEVITGTEFGFWSCVNKIVTVDTTRRSTSYEYRLRKYNEFCTILLPGLDLDRYFDDLQAVAMIRSARARSALARDGLKFSVDWWDSGTNPCEICNKWNCDCDRLMLRIEYLDEISREANAEIAAIFAKYNATPTAVKLRPTSDIAGVAVKKIIREMQGLPACSGNRMNSNASQSGNIIHDRLKLCCSNDIGAAFRHELSYRLEFATSRRSPGPHADGYDLCGASYDYRPERLICQGFASYVHTSYRAGGPTALRTVPPEPPNDATITSNPYTDVNYPNDLDNSNSTVTPLATAPSDLTTDDIYRILTTPNFTSESVVKCADRMWNDLEKYGRMKKKYIRTFRGRDVDTVYSCGRITRRDELREQIRGEAVELHCAFSRIDWIVKNPGRQWTSSMNPIIEDPAEWYGYYHRKVAVGNVQLETTLRLLRLRAPFNTLPPDIFRLLMLQILRADARAVLEPPPPIVPPAKKKTVRKK